MSVKKRFTLTRKGILIFNGGSKNQCYKKSWKRFKYKVELSFERISGSSTVLLNHRNQLFDHDDLDKFIQKNFSKRARSCEKMHLTLYALVWAFMLQQHNCNEELVRYYATIKPDFTNSGWLPEVPGMLTYEVLFK